MTAEEKVELAMIIEEAVLRAWAKIRVELAADKPIIEPTKPQASESTQFWVK